VPYNFINNNVAFCPVASGYGHCTLPKLANGQSYELDQAIRYNPATGQWIPWTQSGGSIPATGYATTSTPIDEALYQALNLYIRGDLTHAEANVATVASLCVSLGTGPNGVVRYAFNDGSGIYRGMWLGTFLYTEMVLNYHPSLPNGCTDAKLQATMWDIQNPDGGVGRQYTRTSQKGSDDETSDSSLLPYSTTLISYVQGVAAAATYNTASAPPKTTFALVYPFGSTLSVSVSPSASSGAAPLSVTFTPTVSGGTSPYSYSWNFGDGSAISTSPIPTHIYSYAGTYTAILTVTDSASNVKSGNTTVVVSGAGPPSPTVAFTIATNPTPISQGFYLDGQVYNTTTSFYVPSGSVHNMTAANKAGTALFVAWNNGGARMQTIAPTINGTSYVAFFTPKANIVQRFSNSGTGSTLTCAFTQPVAQYDVIFVVAGGDNFIHTVTDTFANSYTSQVSTSIVNNTIHAFSNITTASQAHTAGADTVTVTFRASAHGSVVCYDTTGVSGTKAHSSTGTGGWSSKSASYPSVVGSYSPTLGNFEISVMEGAACTSASTPSFPTVTAPQPNTNYGALSFTGSPLVNTGTSCGTPGNFYNFLGSSYTISSLGLATTENWLVTSLAPTSNTANTAQVAADFAVKTTEAIGLSEAVSLTGVAQIRNVILSEVERLAESNHLIPPLFSEPEALFTKYALAQQNNVEKECLGVAITVNSVQTLNTGPLCQVTSVTGLVYTAACNFYQLQCWAYPLLFMGLYVGAAIAFNFSEKGFLYFALAGATYASLIEISLGIMTPTLPIILIALNVAYSFRLDRLVLGRE
jgi:PKD domain-containing protein